MSDLITGLDRRAPGDSRGGNNDSPRATTVVCATTAHRSADAYFAMTADSRETTTVTTLQHSLGTIEIDSLLRTRTQLLTIDTRNQPANTRLFLLQKITGILFYIIYAVIVI